MRMATTARQDKKECRSFLYLLLPTFVGTSLSHFKRILMRMIQLMVRPLNLES